MIFFIDLFGIIEPNKLWKKTVLTIHQLSCFVGQTVLHVVWIFTCRNRPASFLPSSLILATPCSNIFLSVSPLYKLIVINSKFLFFLRQFIMFSTWASLLCFLLGPTKGILDVTGKISHF